MGGWLIEGGGGKCGTRELFDVPPDNPEPQRWRKRENAFSMLAAIQIA